MLNESKKNIRELSENELISFFLEKGEKKFRGKQVYEWLWKKNCSSFDEMTNLSKETRNLLETNFVLPKVKVNTLQKSKDKTLKIAFELHDKHFVEGVLIPAKNRATACISSQIGCKLGCTFCATAKIPFKRNLTAGEIYDQITCLQEKAQSAYNLSLSNIVFMGMGEPLMNYENVLRAIDIATSEKGLGISNRRITLSTVGIPEKIKKLADDGVRFNLAVSLHSAKEETRNKIAPINKKYNLRELTNALKYFYTKTENRITIEYLLLDKINDSLEEAKALAAFCKNFPVKINLIEYNDTGDSKFKKSTQEQTDHFKKFLEEKNMIVNIRRSRGEDIDAACGQLANKTT